MEDIIYYSFFTNELAMQKSAQMQPGYVNEIFVNYLFNNLAHTISEKMCHIPIVVAAPE